MPCVATVGAVRDQHEARNDQNDDQCPEKSLVACGSASARRLG